MRFQKIYRSYIQNNLFVKVILVFAIIVNLTIITLSYFLFNLMSSSIADSELNNQKQAMERVNRYMEQKYESVQSIMQNVYRNSVLASNTSYFLQHPYNDYAQYLLDQNYAGGNASAIDILSYLADKLDADPDIQNILLYSTGKRQLYAFSRNGSRKLYSTNPTRSYIPEIMAAEGPAAGTPNVWIRTLLGQWNAQLYAMRTQVNDNNTLQSIGKLLVYFDAGMVSRSLDQKQTPFKGEILVLTPDGQVMSDSSNRYYGKPYPYMKQLGSLKTSDMLDEPSYISTLTQNKAGYLVVGIMPKRTVAEAYAGIKRTIILISAICIVVAVIVPSVLVVNISRRTNRIVHFMRKVEGGDLSARLQDQREDELGQISRSFNDMLDELGRHIDREYKSELRLKQTELAALQARVNPHFLYNTLEVIRMRAMSQGAADVGEMIYSLAALFRNSVSSRTESTLGEELEMCRLYLELFRIRYKDKFAYEIDCAQELLPILVPKLLLQPVVENYIVHGMDSRRKDNLLTIEAVQAEGMVFVQIRDNGKGIQPDKLAGLRKKIRAPEVEGQDSFGLRSVHDRILLMHGPAYGLHIESALGSGTSVIAYWPAAQKREEAGDV
ncbi:sensor histidine kinase [Paenibacillus sacheonensis]|uniref:HAMP domain-containing protein n=1 Tax=Paenibacillus sacheonensis TaxID=742054 RepID=A0A7X4YKF2_9BACL|nr:sensor histidine kinase [Paenibacillus sacheonensis]MBM7563412.1 two-component system sensor histidine kinase YesM [Paenibacillus sacheonensis]NBC68033.1 HAMP domain-containing protein [Paenibacillus sacheonensis]